MPTRERAKEKDNAVSPKEDGSKYQVTDTGEATLTAFPGVDDDQKATRYFLRLLGDLLRRRRHYSGASCLVCFSNVSRHVETRMPLLFVKLYRQGTDSLPGNRRRLPLQPVRLLCCMRSWVPWDFASKTKEVRHRRINKRGGVCPPLAERDRTSQGSLTAAASLYVRGLL